MVKKKRFNNNQKLLFQKKSVLITGASSGIGFEISKQFLYHGADLIICSSNLSKIKKAYKKLSLIKNKNQKIFHMRVDISSKQQIKKLIRQTIKKFKKIDILINNAGIYGPKGSSETLNWNEWKNTLDINLLGSIYMTNKIIPHFKKKRYGKIIQISGGGAASAFPFFSPYSVSKVGIVRFIENISIELKKYNIYANSIAPGPVNTRMLDQVLKAGPKKVGKNFFQKSIKQKKQGGTDINKVLNLIEFLAHKKSDKISGKLISALWDNWKVFPKNKRILNSSDIGNLRRITGKERNIKFFDK